MHENVIPSHHQPLCNLNPIQTGYTLLFCLTASVHTKSEHAGRQHISSTTYIFTIIATERRQHKQTSINTYFTFLSIKVLPYTYICDNNALCDVIKCNYSWQTSTT